MPPNNNDITIEDARIIFRNFEGREEKFNPKGKRNFGLILPFELADEMLANGWNVKYLKPREEGDVPQPWIQVKVSFEHRPPKLMQVTRRGKTYISEDLVEMWDHADIETADVTITPYDYEVNGKKGRATYLHTMVIKLEENYLEDKWDAIIEQWHNEDRAAENYDEIGA
jgi:hypothetical protein